MSSASKKQGTRVFKKGSPNGKITVYLGKRDFVDHVTHVDPIDGVVLVDPEYLKVIYIWVNMSGRIYSFIGSEKNGMV